CRLGALDSFLLYGPAQQCANELLLLVIERQYQRLRPDGDDLRVIEQIGRRCHGLREAVASERQVIGHAVPVPRRADARPVSLTDSSRPVSSQLVAEVSWLTAGKSVGSKP